MPESSESTYYCKENGPRQVSGLVMPVACRGSYLHEPPVKGPFIAATNRRYGIWSPVRETKIVHVHKDEDDEPASQDPKQDPVMIVVV